MTSHARSGDIPFRATSTFLHCWVLKQISATYRMSACLSEHVQTPGWCETSLMPYNTESQKLTLTVRVGSTSNSCVRYAIFMFGRSLITLPESGSRPPAMICNWVVFPAPLMPASSEDVADAVPPNEF